MIKREITDKIITSVKHFPVVGIIGPRQVGKTTLAKDLLAKLNKPSIYLDLEKPSDARKLNDPELFLQDFSDSIVILDEIQRIPELFPVLRSLIDEHRVGGRFLILGSASPSLLKQSSESLAGRIAYFELQPVYIKETDIPYQEHWLKGGFPEVLLLKDKSIIPLWYENFLTTYVERDVLALGWSASSSVLKRLIRMVAGISGNLLNLSTLADSLGVKVPTIKSYIDLLENSFIVRRLEPYYINISKRLIKAPKIYFRDSGLLNFLAGNDSFENLLGHASAGHFWESYVVQQIIASLPGDTHPYFYRTQHGAEMDLLLVKGNKILMAIEIKLTNAPEISKGMRSCLEDLGVPPALIVTPSADTYLLSKGIIVCSVKNMYDLMKFF